MTFKTMLMGGIAAASLLSAAALAQGMSGPAPAGAMKGPAPAAAAGGFQRNFAQWDKVTMTVEQKVGSNLAIIHGNPGVDTSHPDASGGRVAVLYGPDGVMMVDDNNEEVGAKVLAAVRTLSSGPIKLLVSSHAHGDHTGGNAFFAKQGAVIMAQENLRDELLPNPTAPPRRAGAPAPTPVDPAALPVVTYKYDPATKGKPAVVIHMNGETVDVIPMMPSHMGGDSIIRVRKSQCHLHRGFLPQLRLSLRRPGAMAARSTACDRSHRPDGHPVQRSDLADPPAMAPWSTKGICSPTAPCWWI